MYDLLLFIHVLAAFVLVAGMIAAVPPLVMRMEGPAAERLLKISQILAPVGSLGTLIFGLLLVWDADYRFFSFWIIGALVLWLIGSATGERSGRRPDSPAAGRLLTVAGGAAFLILVLMIWKPGA